MDTGKEITVHLYGGKTTTSCSHSLHHPWYYVSLFVHIERYSQ